ncbi:MAG: riboflavin synthase [Treponema sp.]|nr:riboflavin synthase [Treponema sp.]
MFTGIIEEIGKVSSVGNGRISVQAKKVLEGTRVGDSIAVNGVCLTVTSMQEGLFTADVMNETLSRTNLGLLKSSSPVNLERAMAADGRFGGHIVSGHIDGRGKVLKKEKDGNAVWVYVACSSEILSLIIEKGSIAIDGISLTVAKLSDSLKSLVAGVSAGGAAGGNGEGYFAVSLIPHTGEETTLLGKNPGDIVNLENDIVGKYVKRLLSFGMPASGDALKAEKSQEEKDQKLINWLSL